MQMSALMTSHVVRLARIDEEVWLGACCDASLEEGEAVLWHYGHIVQALDNLQLALQVLCLIEQRGLLVTFWVGLWGVHIAYQCQSITGPPATPTLNTSGWLVISEMVMNPPKLQP